MRPVKQAGDGADGDGDACRIDGTDFFFEGGRADECSADDDADVHSGKHQRGIVGHGLMGADIGEDVAEVQAAEQQAAQDAGGRPFTAFGKQAAEHQDTGQAKGHEEVAGYGRTAFGHLFEQDINDAITRPNGQQQAGTLPAAAFFPAFMFPQQAEQRGKCEDEADKAAARQLFAEQQERGQNGDGERQPLRGIGFDDACRIHCSAHDDEHRRQQHAQGGKQPPGGQVLPPVCGVRLQKQHGEADGGDVVHAYRLFEVDFFLFGDFQQDGYRHAATDTDNKVIHNPLFLSASAKFSDGLTMVRSGRLKSVCLRAQFGQDVQYGR